MKALALRAPQRAAVAVTSKLQRFAFGVGAGVMLILSVEALGVKQPSVAGVLAIGVLIYLAVGLID